MTGTAGGAGKPGSFPVPHVPVVRTGLLFAAIALLWGCGLFGDDGDGGELPASGESLELDLSSSAFSAGAAIPVEHTCDGEDSAPPLTWSDPPDGTGSLALIVEDPDAPGGTFTHWIIFGIDPEIRSLEPGALPSNAIEGENDFGELGYRGPCPPEGETHEYRFFLYALEAGLALDEGTGRDAFLSAIEDNVLAAGRLTGTYQR